MRNYISLLAALMLAFLPSQVMAQDKPIVGIYQMEDLAGSGKADTFSAMIETAIAASGKFRVMERERMNRLLKEQGLAKSGLTTTNTPGLTGGFEGVDYLIYGTITNISVVQKNNVLGTIFSSSNTSCRNAYVTMEADIKITDASTGEVEYVDRISEQLKSDTACGQQAAQIDSGALMRAAADNIATGLVTAIYPIQVATVQNDGTVILNYGEGAILAGDYMNVYAKGEEIRDPATGEVIASNETLLGSIYVTDVQNRISKAQMITQFTNSPPVGAIVRPANANDVKRLKKCAKRKRC